MSSRVPIAALLLVVCAAFDAQAQISRLGFLVPEMGRAQSQAHKGLADELKRLGHDNSRDVVVDVRNIKRDRGVLQYTATDLVKQRPDVIVTTGTSATEAAAAATPDIPIVFIHPGDPNVIGFLRSPKGPRTNLTGVAAFAEEKTDVRLALLKEIVPGLRTVHVFFDWNNRYQDKNFARVETAGRKLGLRVTRHGIKSVEELNATVGGFQGDQSDAIFQIPDELVETAAERIFEIARQKKIPTMFNEEDWAIKGSLAAYGPSYFEMGRAAGRLVQRILKGQKPASLPIERATKFDLILNYRTATFIDVRLPEATLKKADKVIR